MSPVLVFGLTSTTKRQVYFVLATLVIIVSLPIMAVFSLGSSVLSFLDFDFGSSISSAMQLYQGPLSLTVTYEWGNCTYWAALLREKAGNPIPNTWGNANTWAIRAANDGYIVDNTPSVGAIMQTSAGLLGHVAYVESVDAATGAWTISEMNVKGLDIVDTQTLPAIAAINYSFIHHKDASL